MQKLRSHASQALQNHLKGIAYETQILELIRKEKPAYLWKFAPETILIENGIIGSHNSARLNRKTNKAETGNPLADTGIDIIAMETPTECSLIQCKNGYKSGVTMANLAGFMCWMATMPNKLGYVYYTHRLSENVRTLPHQSRIKFIKEPFNEQYLDKLPSSQAPNTSGFKLDSKRLEYQQAAKLAAVEYYKENDNGILSMPCGTGKTYVSYLISQDYQNVIILSPLKQFAKQNIDWFVEYGYPISQSMLVDSDGCRDIETIRKFITCDSTRAGFLLSATYDSADVISALLADIDPSTARTLIIVDEFHNLSESNICEETDYMNRIITSTGFKKLFMSATPRIFDLEETGDSYEYILGTPFYTMPFKFAIDNGFITNYRIWLPSIHEDLGQLHGEIRQELGITDIIGSENVLYSKAIYLFSCLVNTGAHKCIVYCPDTNEIRELMALMTKLNEFYYLDLHMDKITSMDSAESRTQSLAEFASSQRTALLFSVRILDECIDIPSCDSIYITYPTKAKIRTIQRLMRCTRTLPADKHKVGNVFIWCSEYESILDTLGGIKEHDCEFAEKVKINEVGQYRSIQDVKPSSTETDAVEIKKMVIGVKEFRCIAWMDKLEMVKKYMDENQKRPSTTDKDNNIQVLGRWISAQITKYSKKSYIMADSAIYTAWTDFVNHENYKQYFMESKDVWNSKLDKLKTYIDTHKERPDKCSKDDTTRILSNWVSTQVQCYKKRSDIMEDEDTYNKWNTFVNSTEYSQYFIDNNTAWCNTLSSVKTYIDEHNKRPSRSSKDSNIKYMGTWIINQTRNYKIKDRSMKDDIIYNMWTEFINDPKYSNIILNNKEIWYNKLDAVKRHIDEYKQKPSTCDKDPQIKQLGCWISLQQRQYELKTHIMADENIYSSWSDFVNHNDYKQYFMDNISQWNSKFNVLKTYIDLNKKRPDSTTGNLRNWMQTQITNYKKKSQIMSNEEIYNKWSDFMQEYSIYFNK